MIIKKVYPANASVIKKSITFPSGKEICLGSNGLKCYLVTNKEELDFLSKQRDIQIMDPSVKEILEYLEKLPDVPTVDKNVDADEARTFCVSEVEEELLRNELISRGYSVNKSSGATESSSVMNKVSDTAFIKEFARRVRLNSDISKAVGVELSEYVPSELKDMNETELRQAMSNIGWILRKK